ncbi:MAG: hypothetical protein RJB66_283 [Pseudomonadota bacterium]|jgi:hypothetical protein
MYKNAKKLTLVLGSLLAFILLSNVSLAANKVTTCRIAINSTQGSEPVEPTGPADLSGEYSDRKDPGIDNVSDEFDSGYDYNWDGSGGAGGPWSSEF